MSREKKIERISKRLKDEWDIRISKQRAEKIYRVMEHDANMRVAVIVNILCSFYMPLLLVINIPLGIVIYSHSDKLQSFEIGPESLQSYRIWSKVYLLLCIPFFIGVIVAIWLAVTTKKECYDEYLRIYKSIHKNKIRIRSGSGAKNIEEENDKEES